jgi:uncharacterized protein
MVRSSGFEPPRYCYRQPLKLVRLPVPPRPREPNQYSRSFLAAGACGERGIATAFLVGERSCYYFWMSLQLSATEVRVLGALVEKEITTPEYYPLSLNALMNACNQKSNREPVMTLDEESVRKALRTLTEQYMARSASGDSRVAKFEHRLNELYNFHRHEIAVLCVLMLRGPQTPGELRTRTERMYAFADLDAVHAALNLLMRREPPLVKVLPRQAGTKESRFMHLLLGDAEPEMAAAEAVGTGSGSSDVVSTRDRERIEQLETEVAELRSELETLRERFASFQQQFQ